MRRILYPVLFLLIAGSLAWALWPKPISVETATIARQTIETFIEEEGKTRIREIFTVSAPLSGRMARVDLHAGDSVTAGETIIASIRPSAPALLDNRSRRIAEAVVEAARAAVDFAAAQVEQAEAQAEFLKSELERATTLMRRGAIAERTLEKAKLDAATAKAQTQSARATLLVRQRELESASAALIEAEDGNDDASCCITVKAPVSGQVLRVLTESEQVVQTGTSLVELGDPTDLEIVVELLSRDAVRVVPGAHANIDGWGGQPLTAEVVRIDPSAVTRISALGIEEQRVSVVLKATGDLANWRRLGHAFRIIARITVGRRENVVAVPLGALFRSGSKWAAYLVKNERASKVLLQLGERNADFAEVVSGISENDVVILHPGDRIADGVRVSLSN